MLNAYIRVFDIISIMPIASLMHLEICTSHWNTVVPLSNDLPLYNNLIIKSLRPLYNWKWPLSNDLPSDKTLILWQKGSSLYRGTTVYTRRSRPLWNENELIKEHYDFWTTEENCKCRIPVQISVFRSLDYNSDEIFTDWERRKLRLFVWWKSIFW